MRKECGAANFANPLNSLRSAIDDPEIFDVEAGSAGGTKSSDRGVSPSSGSPTSTSPKNASPRLFDSFNNRRVISGVLGTGTFLHGASDLAGELASGVGVDKLASSGLKTVGAVAGEISHGLGVTSKKLSEGDDAEYAAHHLEPRANAMAFRVLKLLDYHQSRSLMPEDLMVGFVSLERFWWEIEEFYPREDLPVDRLSKSRSQDLVNLVLPLAFALAAGDGDTNKLPVCEDFVTQCRHLLSDDPDAIRNHKGLSVHLEETRNLHGAAFSDLLPTGLAESTMADTEAAAEAAASDFEDEAADSQVSVTNRLPLIRAKGTYIGSRAHARTTAVSHLEDAKRGMAAAARVLTLTLYILAYDSGGVLRSEKDGIDLDLDVQQLWDKATQPGAQDEEGTREVADVKFGVAQLRQVLMSLTGDETSLSYMLNAILANAEEAAKSARNDQIMFKQWLRNHQKVFVEAIGNTEKLLARSVLAARRCGDHVLIQEVESYVTVSQFIKRSYTSDAREVFDLFKSASGDTISGVEEESGRDVWRMYDHICGMRPFDKRGKPIRGMAVHQVQMSVPVRLNKEETLLERKLQFVTQLDLLHNLPTEARNQVASKMTQQSVRAFDSIIEKGTVGKEMHFIVAGAVEIFVDEGAEPMATLGEGQFFGETSLLTNKMRNADVRAAENTTLFVLSKDDLNAVIETNPELKEILQNAVERRSDPTAASVDEPLLQRNIGLLSTVDILHNLPKLVLSQLASALSTRRVSAGEYVIKRGDVGEEMYLVVSGEATVTNALENPLTKPLSIKRGEFFGELALLKQEKRSADVHAKTDMELLILTKHHLDSAIGEDSEARTAFSEAGLRRMHPDVSFDEFSAWWESPACKLRRISETLYRYGQDCMHPDAAESDRLRRISLKGAVNIVKVASGIGGQHKRAADFQGYL
jgi:CRP-like cAMP-binding protein